mgnify:FL=1
MPKRNAFESELVTAALALLQLNEFVAFRVNNTGVFDPKRRVFRSFRGRKGVSDIIAIGRGFKDEDSDNAGECFGKMICIECKTIKGVVSADQKAFLRDIEVNGGVALVIRCLDDLSGDLRELGYFIRD